MACLLVPLAEAVVVSTAEKIAQKKCGAENEKFLAITKETSSLKKVLYGGSFLLAIEHIYHGEIFFAPPFLSGFESTQALSTMLHEMATSGVAMALAATAFWGVATCIKLAFKKSRNASKRNSEG